MIGPGTPHTAQHSVQEGDCHLLGWRPGMDIGLLECLATCYFATTGTTASTGTASTSGTTATAGTDTVMCLGWSGLAW